MITQVNGTGYYSVYKVETESAMSFLRERFPVGEADELNFTLFSTSGVHGSYLTIEEVENRAPDATEVTFLLIQPRTVTSFYGNVRPETPEDFVFLKKLRASSIKMMERYGK